MITPVWIVGFTGHRPKDSPGRTSAEMEHIAPLIRQELADLKGRAEARGGRAELLCGLGAGADIIAAREAEALGMPVHVILPMPESHFGKDFAAPAFQADWREAQRFIRLAQAGAGGATFRVAHGSQLRDDCYYDLGAQIVYASDAVIALWDGQPAPPVDSTETADGVISPGRGGTADVVDLAQADRMPYLKGKEPKGGYKWLPTPLRLINALTRQITGEAAHFAGKDDAGLAEIQLIQHAANAQHGKHKPLNSAGELMEFVDRGAKDWAKRLRGALLWGSGLHFLASLIAAVSAGSQKVKLGIWTPTSLAGIELALVLFAIGLLLWSHWKHAQARWLELRLATELTRGLVAAGRLLDPLFPIATDHLPGWRRFCLSVGLTIARSLPPIEILADPAQEAKARALRFNTEKQTYVTNRIDDQISHFDKNDPCRRHKWHRIANAAGPVTSVLAVGFIVLALAHKVHEAQIKLATPAVQPSEPLFWESMLYYFLPIALPLLAGAIASLQSVTDVKRRAHVYPEMVERLRSARDLIPAIRTPASLRRFVRRTEEILLDELVGWYAAAKGISH